MLGRPFKGPHGRGADRNLQHRIMVVTILRRIRNWSATATPLCCQRIYLPTIISPAAIWSRPFCDSRKFGRDGSIDLLPRVLSNAVLDGPLAGPHTHRADQNPQHRIMVMTVFRWMRKWSDDAFSSYCQRIYLSTIFSPAAIRSHPFCDTRKISRDGSLALFPHILSNALLDRPSTVPHGSGADRNPQRHILVVTVLR